MCTVFGHADKLVMSQSHIAEIPARFLSSTSSRFKVFCLLFRSTLNLARMCRNKTSDHAMICQIMQPGR